MSHIKKKPQIDMCKFWFFCLWYCAEKIKDINREVDSDWWLYMGLILCSKKKILTLESRDLSQTDTVLIIASSFSKLTHLRNDCLLNWANSQNDNYFHSKWSLVVVLSENSCQMWICSDLQAVISFSALDRSRDSWARIFFLEYIMRPLVLAAPHNKFGGGIDLTNYFECSLPCDGKTPCVK